MPTHTKPAADRAAGQASVSPSDLLMQARDLQSAMFHRTARRAWRGVARWMVTLAGAGDAERLRSAGSRAH